MFWIDVVMKNGDLVDVYSLRFGSMLLFLVYEVSSISSFEKNMRFFVRCHDEQQICKKIILFNVRVERSGICSRQLVMSVFNGYV